MANVIGRVGFVLKGAWDNSTSYEPLDVVIHNGNGYSALNPNQNVEPGSLGDTSWKLIVEKGDKGDPGNFTWQQVTDYVDAVYGAMEVTFTNVSSLPTTQSAVGMTGNHKLMYIEMTNPDAFISLTATPSTDSVTLSGTLVTGTSSTVYTRWMII